MKPVCYTLMTIVVLCITVATASAQLQVGPVALESIILSGGFYRIAQAESYIDKASGPGGEVFLLFNITPQVGFFVSGGYHSMNVTEMEEGEDQYPWADFDDALDRWEWGFWDTQSGGKYYDVVLGYHNSSTREIVTKVEERSNVTTFSLGLTARQTFNEKVSGILFGGAGVYIFERKMWMDDEFRNLLAQNRMSDVWQDANPNEDGFWFDMQYRVPMPPKRGTAYGALIGGTIDWLYLEQFGLNLTLQYTRFVNRQDFFPFDGYMNVNAGLSFHY